MSLLLYGTGGVTTPAATLTTTPLAVASGGTGVTTKTGTGAVVLGTSPTLATPTFDSAQLPTISGTAPLYMCRAWVNFNGTGTVAIRASGNVSSITDNGTGDYTVNFTTAMPDVNYATTTGGSIGAPATGDNPRQGPESSVYAAGAVRIRCGFDNGLLTDWVQVTASVFR
jgi:hypothetical protein